MEFEWDSEKNAANKAAHGIDFNDAKYIFTDPCRLEDLDPGSHSEERWRVIGVVDEVLLFVVYTERKDKTRLISARPATQKERNAYRNRTFGS